MSDRIKCPRCLGVTDRPCHLCADKGTVGVVWLGKFVPSTLADGRKATLELGTTDGGHQMARVHSIDGPVATSQTGG